MIISHKLKVIFIKTYKTAGSSFELALSKYCGLDDTYTPVNSELHIRRSWNIPEYQNTTIRGEECRNHAPAFKVKADVPKDIWHNYLKVSIIRCPYDTVISEYYWSQRKKQRPNVNMTQWFFKKLNKSFPLYDKLCINNRPVIDFLIRYEHLNEDIKKLEIKIGCPGLLETFQNIRTKSNIRPPGKDIYTVYSQNPIARAIMDKWYEKTKQNELIERYYPIYRERLNQKIGLLSPRYLSFVADLIHEYSSFKEFMKKPPIELIGTE